MTSPIAAALAALPRPVGDAAQPDPTLPPCPLCTAQARAGGDYAAWDRLSHTCNCDLEAPLAYDAGLRRLWRQRNALPLYLETLPTRYHGYTADALKVTPENAPVTAVLKEGLTGNLFLYGPAGTGKTHLAIAGARRFAERGKTARFWGMAALIQQLRLASAGEVARPELEHWDVLVLDDIDKIRPTPFVYESLYTLFESRWANEKITIFTAQNDPDRAAAILTPEGNEVAADPMASRMASGRVFKVAGADRRAAHD